MEHNRQIKILSIVALVIAIVGMSLGFAAFSTTLKITSSASVSPSSGDFKIAFAYATEGFGDENNVVAYPGSYISASSAKISETGLSDINIVFSEPGQSATYEFLIKNVGKYDAYLTEVDFGENPVCQGVGDTTDLLVNAACQGMGRSMLVGNTGVYETTKFNNFILKAGESITARLDIAYSSTAARADGEFSVSFDDISCYFSSADSELIQFSIYSKDSGNTSNYTAIKGMTWRDWLKSSFNVGMGPYGGFDDDNSRPFNIDCIDARIGDELVANKVYVEGTYGEYCN